MRSARTCGPDWSARGRLLVGIIRAVWRMMLFRAVAR